MAPSTPNPIRDHPSLTLHLSDTSLLPLVSHPATTSNSPPKDVQKALSKLTSTYLTVQEISTGLGLGEPQQVTVETDGGVGLVQRYIPPVAREGGDSKAGAVDETLPSPALVATALAGSRAQIEEAGTAVWGLEKVGRGFQRVWGREHMGEEGRDRAE